MNWLRKLFGSVIGKLRAFFVFPISQKRHDSIVAEIKRQAGVQLMDAITKHNQVMADERKRHEADLKKNDETMKKVVERIAKIQFARGESLTYKIMLTFDARAFGMDFCPQSELRYLARHVGRMVEEQIATKQFVSSVADYDYQNRLKMMPDYKMFPEQPI